MGLNRLYSKKILLPILTTLTLILFFQNCRLIAGNDFEGDSSTLSSSSTIDPGPCPAEAQGNPEISDLFISGTKTIATVVTAKSGYTDDSGNGISNPILELSLLKTNVVPANVCDQSATVQCSITMDSGATGVLWGTNTRVPIRGKSFECVTSSGDLDIDVEGKAPTDRPNKTTLQVQPRNQSPDITAERHVCMEGSATVSVRLRNPYNKDSAPKTFKLNFTNSCPKEQKVNAETEAEAQGLFGESVSISGNRAAVLTTGLNAYSLSNVGGARIYEHNGTSWSYITTLIPPTSEIENDIKPTTVLLNGNNLFVGNAASSNQTGRVWLFQRDGSGNWNKTQTLNGSALSKFGTSLAFEGNHLFVGAPSVNGVGSVRVFSLSGATLTAVSTINGVEANSDFGASLAVSGSNLIIGAPGSATNTSTSGTFFNCSIASISNPSCTAWVLTSNKIGGETIPPSSRLGSSVALKNNLLLVSAKNWYPSNMTTPPNIRNGLVALIDLSKGTTAIKIFRGGSENLFGASIAFGTTSFFIGVKESFDKRGHVMQMGLPTDGSVNASLRYNYYGLDQGPLDRFGSSIAVSGGKLLVGAPLDQEQGYSTAGSATFFNILNP